MTRPRIYRTEAIVLQKSPLGEAANLLTIYTPYLGKFKVVAKGVQRPLSKLSGHLQLLSHSLLLLAQGQNLDIVTQAQTLDSFMLLQEDLQRAG